MAQSEEPAAGGRPSRRRLVVRALLAVAVVAAVYLGLLPNLVDVEQVWATLRAMTWLELATLLLAAVWNLVSYLLPQLAATPGLSLRQAALESHASTAVGSLLPAGQAVGLGVTYRFYTSYGFGSGPITLSLLVQGVWNNFMKLGMPIVARGCWWRQGRPTGRADRRRCRAGGVRGRRGRVRLRACRKRAAGAGWAGPWRRGRGRAAGSSAGRAAGLGTRRRGLRAPQAITLLRGRWHWLNGQPWSATCRCSGAAAAATRRGVRVGGQLGRGAGRVRAGPDAVGLPVTRAGSGVVELGLAAPLSGRGRRTGGRGRAGLPRCSPSSCHSRSAPSPGGSGAAARWYPSQRPVMT